MKEGESSSIGYILRIARDEWVKQVFDLKKYYVGVRGRFEPGLTIFFARKAERGDSFLGYGFIEKVQELEELSDEERSECEKWGWKRALNFKSVVRFEPPLPIKETVMKDARLWGSRLHGYRLALTQVQAILNKTEKGKQLRLVDPQRIIEKEREVLFREMVKIPSTTYATFALYRYPAKFIPQVVTYILENYASPGMEIFDPFAGYGTVGVVSRIYSCNYELWDLNPLLEILHAVATLEPRKVKIKELLHQMVISHDEFTPKWSRLCYWFPQDFLPFLFNVWGFYHSLDDTYLKLLLTIPLLKTTRYFSYDDMQRQKLSKSQKSERRVKLLLACDWKTRFIQMVEKETGRILKGIQEYWALSPKQTRAIVKGGLDTLGTNLEEEKDILITSPPYLQSQEYIRQAKLDLFWLGYSENEVRKLSKLEIPYRDVGPQPVYSEIFTQWESEIEELHLRKVFDRYFWGVLGALTRLQEKVRSYIFLFAGRACVRGRPVPIDRIFAEHFASLGWIHEATLVDTIVGRRMFFYSTNPATGRKDRRTKVENLVILRRGS